MTTKTIRPPDRLAVAALITASGYAAVRACWQIAGTPDDLSSAGPDLVMFDGWWGVALCLAAAALAAAMLRPRSASSVPALMIAGTLISLALVGAAAMIVLDAIGGLFPGLGVELFPLGAASRTTCISAGLLLALATRSMHRRSGVELPGGDRARALTARLERTPWWAYWAAYVSMTGCLTRVAAQTVVGVDESPLSSGPVGVMFELCFVLAGTLLPLALVHRWGRIWPRWVVGFAGRRVPRWLVLGPAIGVAAAIVVYFGVLLGQMVAERLQGRNPFPPDARMDLPEAFFWVAVPAYVVWGAALSVAALAYHRTTRKTA